MSEEKTTRVNTLVQELGSALKNHNYKDAYTFAGELNAILKSDVKLDISTGRITEIMQLVKRYYTINEQFQDVSRKFYGVGSAFLEI